MDVFSIPLGCETTNSKETFVFAVAKSISLGVNVNASTIGFSYAAFAVFGIKLVVSKSAKTIDLIFILNSFSDP